MRSLRKNKQTIWYSVYKGKSPEYIYDDNGEAITDTETGKTIETGNYIPIYEKPIEIDINVSAGRSDSSMDVFGTNIEYDRVLCTTETNLPISETTLIWKETEPKFLDDGTVDYMSADYRVVASPVTSINSTLIAIAKNKKAGDGIAKNN